MRKSIVWGLLTTSLLAGCQSTPFRSSPTTLSAEEVRHLFVGNTVESFNLLTGFNSHTYYRPDGRALQERLWSRRAGQWSIRDDGQICLAFGDSTLKCRNIVRHNGRHYKVVPDKAGNPEKIIRYRYFATGNVLNL